jgi:putative membrane protein (TIGR04086 family)
VSVKQKVSFTSADFLRSAGIGAGIGIVTTILILVLLSAVMLLRDIPHAMIEPLAVSAAAVGGMIGGFAASKLLGEKGLAAGFCSGIVIFFPITIYSFFTGSFGFGSSALLKLATILIAASSGGVMGVNTGRKRK